MFCFHKYDKVQLDGYQYCKKCGNAIVPPCAHKWIIFSNILANSRFGCEKRHIGHMFQCEKCGITQQVFLNNEYI